MSDMARTELGCPGHLIIARWCQFRRHTQIGTRYRISTLGNYFPCDGGQRDTIGAGPDAFFETMVFVTTTEQDPGNEGCGCLQVRDWSEVEGRRSATAGEAQATHEATVTKYLALARAEAPDA
jgi:hypothetical protein